MIDSFVAEFLFHNCTHMWENLSINLHPKVAAWTNTKKRSIPLPSASKYDVSSYAYCSAHFTFRRMIVFVQQSILSDKHANYILIWENTPMLDKWPALSADDSSSTRIRVTVLVLLCCQNAGHALLTRYSRVHSIIFLCTWCMYKLLCSCLKNGSGYSARELF